MNHTPTQYEKLIEALRIALVFSRAHRHNEIGHGVWCDDEEKNFNKILQALKDGELNSLYIVHCVNQHEKLIEALTALLYHSDYDEGLRPLQAKRIREAEKLIKQESEG